MSGWRLTADIEGLLSRARERRDGFRCHDATSRPPGAYLTKAYAPKCLEEEFCELRLYGVLGSSLAGCWIKPRNTPPRWPWAVWAGAMGYSSSLRRSLSLRHSSYFWPLGMVVPLRK